MRAERDNWLFTYKASELLPPTRRRLDYHKKREANWRDESEKVEKKIRASGISLEEYEETLGARFEARIDMALGRRLSECRDKEKKHRALREQFEVFASEFERELSKEYQLAVGDIRFFGLLGEVAGAEAED